MKLRKIVVGVDLDAGGGDLGPGARAALERAGWLAAKTGASIDLLHSTAEDRFEERSGVVFRLVHTGVPPRACEAFDGAVAALSEAGIEAEVVVREEKPWIALTRHAELCNADLIVLGKHDAAEPRTSLGSVARRVVHHAPRPVWLARHGEDLGLARIVACTDLSETGALAVRTAADLAALSGAELHVVHVYQITFEAQLAPGRLDADAEERAHDAAAEALRAGLAAAGVSDAKTHVVRTTPVHGILSVDEELRPDVLVMGSVSRIGIVGLIVGNTAEKCLERVRAALLVVKPEGFAARLADR
jgi:nucleotide-binding universal stress UspA family protein